MSDDTPEKQILHDLGYFGHYLHVHRGGRNGKQHILKTLATAGNMTQRELQEQSCITSASLSEVLAKLEGEGLVTRTRSDEDRRQLALALTPQGEARAHEVMAKREAFEREALAIFSEQERNELLDLLDRLRIHWSHLEVKERETIACNKN